MTALLDLPAMMSVAGLPCNSTVLRVSPVAGHTMAAQVLYTALSVNEADVKARLAVCIELAPAGRSGGTLVMFRILLCR